MGRIILFFFSTFGFFYGSLPRRVQLALGNFLGSLLWLVKLRHSIIQQNLSLAFPGQDDLQKKVARESYSYLGNLILEIFMVLGPLKNFVLKYVDVTGMERIAEARKKGKGVILLSSHLGNWEVMAATGGVIAKEDLMLVTKRIKPEWLHQGIEKGRKKCGVTAAYEPQTLKQILSHLKKNRTIGFVLDQYAGPPVGVRVPFFGVPVGTTLAVAALVKRTGAVLLPVENYRKPDGRWAVIVHPEPEWQQSPESQDSHYELAANTALYASLLEKSILKHPEQWLWTHRRFKGDLTALREDEWKEGRARK